MEVRAGNGGKQMGEEGKGGEEREGRSRPCC